MEKTGDSNALKRHLSWEKDCLTGRVRCFEVNNGIRGKELAERLNFAESQWRSNADKCLAADSLPLIFVPVQPQAMPPELIPLAPDAMIVLRNETSTYDVLKRVEDARAVINAAIERNRLGRFTVREVAFLLARANKSSPLAMYERLVKAFLKSDFSCRDTLDSFPIDVTEKMEELKKMGLNNPKYLIHDEWAFTTATQVNKWLDKIDDEAILPRLQNASPATTHPAPPVVADSAPGGTTVVWTTERKEAARAMMNEQRGQGVKAFAANTAAAFGVTPSRLRQVLNGKPKKTPAKKTASDWRF